MVGRGPLVTLLALLIAGATLGAHAPVTKTRVAPVYAQQVRTVSPARWSQAVAIESTSAAALGSQVMKSVSKGHVVAGVVERQSPSEIWVRTGSALHPSTESFTLSSGTVTWQGGWTFLGGQDLRHKAVNLVVQHHTVLGVLTYRNAYGRVVHMHAGWVVIETVKGSKHSNPACRRPYGPLLFAKILTTTVWNSRKGLLPQHSLVQFTVYGTPGYPVLLGGVEDYGHAACPAPKPAVAREVLGSV